MKEKGKKIMALSFVFQLRLFPGGEPVTEVSSKVSETVKLLLAATDVGNKAEAKAWEDKVLACEHTLLLQQGEPVQV